MTNGAIRNDMEWLRGISIKAWNTRSEIKTQIFALVDEVIKANWNDFFKEPNSLYLQTTLTELKQKIEAL